MPKTWAIIVLMRLDFLSVKSRLTAYECDLTSPPAYSQEVQIAKSADY